MDKSAILILGLDTNIVRNKLSILVRSLRQEFAEEFVISIIIDE